MPVTDRPLQPSPWAVPQDARAGKPGVHSTNLLIAVACVAMVAISALAMVINGVN